MQNTHLPFFPMENLNVIIIGAGMAGLAAGIALQQAGYRVAIHERFTDVRPAGAAISLWPNGVKVLNRLGLGEKIAAIGGRMETMGYRNGFTGEVLTHFSLEPLVRRVGERPYPVPRTALQNMLMDALGREHIHFGSTLTGIEEDAEGVTAFFENGTSARADLIVAADGTHSILRNHVIGHPAERRYCGYVNWNGLVAASEDIAPAGAWVTHVGEGKRVSTMPLADGQLYFFFDVPLEKGLPAEKGRAREELAAHFSGWAAPVQRLIATLDPTTTTRLEIHDVAPLTRLARGRVVLVGDSGHSTAPDLGQGGCQAMEGAWVLANCLKSHTLGIPDCLTRYQDLRIERVAGLITGARKRSNITHAMEPEKTAAWYEELKQEDGSAIMDAIARTILAGPLH